MLKKMSVHIIQKSCISISMQGWKHTHTHTHTHTHIHTHTHNFPYTHTHTYMDTFPWSYLLSQVKNLVNHNHQRCALAGRSNTCPPDVTIKTGAFLSYFLLILPAHSHPSSLHHTPNTANVCAANVSWLLHGLLWQQDAYLFCSSVQVCQIENHTVHWTQKHTICCASCSIINVSSGRFRHGSNDNQQQREINTWKLNEKQTKSSLI